MTTKTFKILVVDDEIDFQTLFKLQYKKEIESGELNIIFANNGKIALEHLKDLHDTIDLVTIDLNMPFINGNDFFHTIKKEYPALKSIIISGVNKHEIKENYIELGAVAQMAKPLDFFKFRLLIEKLKKTNQ